MLRWVGRARWESVRRTVGVAMLAGVAPAEWSWLAAVGLAKLTSVASGGLLAGGATCLRLDKRSARRRGTSNLPALRDERLR